MGQEMILRLANISKTFPGVKALENVSFDLRKGRGSCTGRRKRCRQKHIDEYSCRNIETRQWVIVTNGEKISIKSPIHEEKVSFLAREYVKKTV